jgi:RNA polymerase sigma-70 factor (ECF subfamily)
MDECQSELIKRINAGDRDAMARFIQFRRHDLLAVVLHRMGPALRKRIEADDILQDVAATAVSSMNELDFSDGGPFGWLCELIQRKIVDAERRFSAGKRAAHHEVGIDAGSDPSCAGIANLLIASITSPSKAFSRQQKEFDLLQAMEQMPEEQRKVLHMRYADGRATRDIAREIGKSDGATRVLLTRALQKLRSMVGSETESQ